MRLFCFVPLGGIPERGGPTALNPSIIVIIVAQCTPCTIVPFVPICAICTHRCSYKYRMQAGHYYLD